LCAGRDDTESLIGDPRSRDQQSKESIVEDLWSVEVDEPESVEFPASDEDERVSAWRVERLSDLGLSNIVASAIAPFVDWHEIARLVERGCSPELALEIVR
jgi:hypothetical protein